ncbi:ABC transporter ATP-binding protein [Gynurincola endophyticus]|uniref:ABC transporter ATP-binding protein n=1 Tax=Gynurincola endophyticus TaxID=2479004 RepID=UPI000F8E8272|nr:ABC transporter ATP-binding protein [Gynurincola endophyticus]
MKHLKVINKYFWKYRKLFFLGIVFIVLSNYFKILTPQITGFVIDEIQLGLLTPAEAADKLEGITIKQARYDWNVRQMIEAFKTSELSFSGIVIWTVCILLALSIISGFFMFLMRQTIIVMSRHIEFDQKNEVFQHYLKLDSMFFKKNSTGDLMNRIAEDVSRVRSYTGPALMYFINLAATIGFSLYFMFSTDMRLSLYVLAPLPILALIIYLVNTVINRKSERIQQLLSQLTTNAQESYSGIRVIKSFVQERSMLKFFKQNSEEYRHNAIGLAKLEAVYFPTMGLLIGLSTLIAVMMGGIYAINHEHGVTVGTIIEFVIYVNMLTFPVSAIGWTASMIQRAAASQKRLNEFLDEQPAIESPANPKVLNLGGPIEWKNIDFTYSNTGIRAMKKVNFAIQPGEKVAIIGSTGSGKTTIAQLLLRMFDPNNGDITINGISLKELDLHALRSAISYVPQDVFLFSDTIANNIRMGKWESDQEEIEKAARYASIHKEIMQFPENYQTLVGERGVTLSGGQKQRISIARALIKDPELIILDDCLSAVDARTEREILGNLNTFLQDRTAIVITHRIFSLMQFDKILVLEEGEIIESGTHEQLLSLNGRYTELFQQQQAEDSQKK